MNTPLLFLLSFLISQPLFCSDCGCFLLGNNRNREVRLENALSECIYSFPELERLNGIYFHGSLFKGKIDRSEAIDHYLYDYSPVLSSTAIQNSFSILRRDFLKELARLKNKTHQRLNDLISGKEHCYWVDEFRIPQCIPYAREKLARFQVLNKVGIIKIDETESLFYQELKNTIAYCMSIHENPMAFYEQGSMYFLEGNYIEAIKEGIKFVQLSEEKPENVVLSQVYLLEGESFNELALYENAITSLTEAIKLNPSNKNAFFERASAYFEMGAFDSAFEDYIRSEVKAKAIKSSFSEQLSFSMGLTKGALDGGIDGFKEFVPSCLSSIHGIGQTLWAFVQDPIQISGDFIEASYECIDYLKNHTPKETLAKIVPELHELINENPDSKRQGEIFGYVVGKYGVDIFAGIGITKAMSSFRKLKKANSLLTFDAASLSERNRLLIISEAKMRAESRKQVLNSANLKIQPDKQGKHIVGHSNYNTISNKSILTHSDPQKLINEHAGKGMRVNKIVPGMEGYQEIIDFKEHIGFYLEEAGIKKIETSWGKIHYAKDGVHVVPTKPRNL